MTDAKEGGLRVVLAIPTITRPFQACLDAVEASIPHMDAAGIKHSIVFETGNPYVSAARATMLHKALEAKADAIVFIDHDMSWAPEDLATLIMTEGDVVAGTYRFKTDVVEYMGAWETDAAGIPVLRDDGCIRATKAPAGFLKVTRKAVAQFARAYPNLCYGDPLSPAVDLFNHGAHEGVWWGEDYAFCRNWRACGGDVWIVPDLSLDHHTADKVFPGNLHQFLMRQPGGCLAEAA